MSPRENQGRQIFYFASRERKSEEVAQLGTGWSVALELAACSHQAVGSYTWRGWRRTPRGGGRPSWELTSGSQMSLSSKAWALSSSCITELWLPTIWGNLFDVPSQKISQSLPPALSKDYATSKNPVCNWAIWSTWHFSGVIHRDCLFVFLKAQLYYKEALLPKDPLIREITETLNWKCL